MANESAFGTTQAPDIPEGGGNGNDDGFGAELSALVGQPDNQDRQRQYLISSSNQRIRPQDPVDVEMAPSEVDADMQRAIELSLGQPPGQQLDLTGQPSLSQPVPGLDLTGQPDPRRPLSQPPQQPRPLWGS